MTGLPQKPMLLFDDLAAALHDLPSDRYGAVTRALSKLGIRVSRDPITSSNDGGLHLVIKVEFGTNAPQEATFHEQTRRWQVSSTAPTDVNRQQNGRHAKRQQRTASTNKQPPNVDNIPDIEPLTLEHSVSKDESEQEPEAATPRFAPSWLDQLPQTPHLEFIKSRNWAATELGPIEQWPAPLRLMFRKMLADPRAANLYW